MSSGDGVMNVMCRYCSLLSELCKASHGERYNAGTQVTVCFLLSFKNLMVMGGGRRACCDDKEGKYCSMERKVGRQERGRQKG